jgi:hypothetical protein
MRSAPLRAYRVLPTVARPQVSMVAMPSSSTRQSE